MEHFYDQTIGEDWFTFTNLYRDVVSKFNDAHFVEVGTWKGRSASFMAVEIINSNKNIKFDCVDNWLGSKEHLTEDSHNFNPELLNNSEWLYELFLKNIEPVKDIINPIRMNSIDASKLYEDESLEFVFIDASHEYEDVLLDIKHWFPKVKYGGILAGHDIGRPEVKKAVIEFFKDNFYETEISWVHNKI